MNFRNLFEEQNVDIISNFVEQSNDLTEFNDESSVSDSSDVSDIDLDAFDDDPDFEFRFPNNSICFAHSLQLVLKDVFENCDELKALKKVCVL